MTLNSTNNHSSRHRLQVTPVEQPQQAAQVLACVPEAVASNALPEYAARMNEFLLEIVERLLLQDLTPSLIADTCKSVMHFLGYDLFVNYLLSEGGKLHLNASEGLEPSQLLLCAVKAMGQGVSGRVAETRQFIVITATQNSDPEEYACILAMGIRSYACCPLVAKDQLIGTLAFGSGSKESFEPWELDLIRMVCSHVAAAIHRLNTETNLERMALELQGKNDLITDFFTNISHEFKTPLSIILVNLQLMEYRMNNNGARHEGLDKAITVMRQNSLRLLKLIGNLLDVTKIDAGFMNPQFAEGDVVELVRGLVSLWVTSPRKPSCPCASQAPAPAA